MRKKTVNIITWYMVVGAALNIIGIYVMSEMTKCSTGEAVLTIIALNGIYIFFARDTSIIYERACSEQHKNKSTHVH